MHYTMYELDQYRSSRAMSWFRRLCCRFHLRHCRRCRERLIRLSMDDILISDLRKSTQAMSVPENPGEYHALCGLFHEESGRRRSTL